MASDVDGNLVIQVDCVLRFYLDRDLTPVRVMSLQTAPTNVQVTADSEVLVLPPVYSLYCSPVHCVQARSVPVRGERSLDTDFN